MFLSSWCQSASVLVLFHFYLHLILLFFVCLAFLKYLLDNKIWGLT